MEWILSLGQSDIEFMVADGSVYDAECVTPTSIYHSQMTHLTDKYPIATESNMFVIFVLFVCFFFCMLVRPILTDLPNKFCSYRFPSSEQSIIGFGLWTDIVTIYLYTVIVALNGMTHGDAIIYPP